MIKKNNNKSNIYLLNTENKDDSKNEIRSNNLYNSVTINEISNSNLFHDEFTVTRNVCLVKISDH